MIKIVKKLAIPILLLLTVPFSCQSFFFEEIFDDLDEFLPDEINSQTQIINEINVSTNTGGNVTNNGEVKEGEGKTEVEIKNIINGKEIEPVQIETEASEVSIESEIKVENGKAQVSREIEIDSEKQTENYEVDLENLTPETEDLITDAEKEITKKITQEIKEEIKKQSERIINNLQNWWSDLVEGIKSLFGNIFKHF